MKWTIPMLILATLVQACGSVARAGDGDLDEGELESDQDAQEDALDEGEPEVPPDTFDGLEGAEEPLCGAPGDDCDGDGWTPAEGDCCDELAGVHPGADWATEPYACPDESWDWDCSGEVEVQAEDVGDGLEAVLPDGGCEGIWDSLGCNAADGWTPAPECGVEAVYVHCFWYSTPYTYGCFAHDPPTWTGTVACR